MKPPTWITKPDASADALAKQLEAVQQLLADGERDVAAKQGRFDEIGTPEAAKALQDAKVATETARLHVDRAQRLLDAAREREAQAERERLLARKAQLMEQLSPAAVRAAVAPLVEKELAALQAVVAVRLEKVSLRDGFRGLEGELLRIQSALGEDVAHLALGRSVSEVCVNHVITANALEQLIAQLPADDPRREILLALEPRPSHIYHHYCYGVGVQNMML